MRLDITRLWKRQLEQRRFGDLNPYAGIPPVELRRKAMALRQPEPAGIHCKFCGEIKKSFDAPCPNDGPSWPHPKVTA